MILPCEKVGCRRGFERSTRVHVTRVLFFVRWCSAGLRAFLAPKRCARLVAGTLAGGARRSRAETRAPMRGGATGRWRMACNGGQIRPSMGCWSSRSGGGRPFLLAAAHRPACGSAEALAQVRSGRCEGLALLAVASGRISSVRPAPDRDRGRSGAVVGVDAHVVRGEVAGPSLGVRAARREIDAEDHLVIVEQVQVSRGLVLRMRLPG